MTYLQWCQKLGVRGRRDDYRFFAAFLTVRLRAGAAFFARFLVVVFFFVAILDS